MGRRNRDRFVADGQGRIRSAERRRVAGEVKARYAAQMAAAGFWARIRLRWRVWREIERELARIAPRDGFY